MSHLGTSRPRWRAWMLLSSLLVTGGVGHPATLASGPSAVLPSDDAAIVHLLNRATFGSRPQDVQRVRQAGIEAWIDEQLEPARISDSAVDARLEGFTTLSLTTEQLARDYFLPAQMERRQLQQRGQEGERTPTTGAAGGAAVSGESMAATARPDAPRGVGPGARPVSPAIEKERLVLAELTGQKVLRAIYSERQLQEVLVDFWFNHFNVFAGKGQTRVFMTSYERDVIRPDALGRFRDLLGATAKSPAMLFYLDNWMSSDPNAAPPGRGRGGAGQGRMAAGRAGVAGTGPAQPPQQMRRGLNENYARELLELHTLGVDGGYTQQDVTEIARAFTGWTIDRPQSGGSYRFDDRRHVKGTKRILGQEIKAGGERDGEAVLDLLARHPSTARFIATKLARRFVADDPPASLVDRAAKRFTDTDGDIREVVRTILTSPEFFAPEARRAKVKTPFEFVISALRASHASVNDARAIVAALRDLGMPPYLCQPPTGYADTADSWVNTGALLGRMNYAMQMVNVRSRGVQVDAAKLIGPGTSDGRYDALASTLLGAPMSDATRAQVEKATTAQQAAALILGSPEFQRR
jgi:uncharacterized protein (DUF1800 family)